MEEEDVRKLSLAFVLNFSVIIVVCLNMNVSEKLFSKEYMLKKKKEYM